VKLTFLLIAIALAAFLGEWAYRTMLRPAEPLAPEVVALANHLTQSGIQARPYPVRHGFRHSQVTSAASLELADFPLPVSVSVCATEEAAIEMHARFKSSPNLMHPRRIGRLVTYLPMWGDDTETMAKRVQEALDAFSPGA
jgi:hypothetical protein